jgi:hypothetical protein
MLRSGWAFFFSASHAASFSCHHHFLVHSCREVAARGANTVTDT